MNPTIPTTLKTPTPAISRDTKVTVPGQPRYSIICLRRGERATAADQAGKVKHASSTVLQPYIGLNYDPEGTLVGGRTMSESEVSSMLVQVAKLGGTIEEI